MAQITTYLSHFGGARAGIVYDDVSLQILRAVLENRSTVPLRLRVTLPPRAPVEFVIAPGSIVTRNLPGGQNAIMLVPDPEGGVRYPPGLVIETWWGG